MNPITKFLKDLFASKRILGGDTELQGLAKADALLSTLANEGEIPGIAVKVLREGKVILEKGYGYASLEEKEAVNPKTTVFRVASVSKPISATALVKMVAEGTIGLDDSIYRHVPSFPNKGKDITIRQLAGHTAGIRGYRGKEYALNKPYSIKDSLEIFQDDDLLFEPGRGYHYNSYDWVLVSLAMQEATGQPFEKYVEQRVLQPLGMQHTFPEVSTSPDLTVFAAEEKASCYTKTRSGFKKAVPVNNAYKLAGGGYLSTVGDIAKLGQAYLDGRIANQKLLSEFLSPQSVDGQSTYYGLGWQVSKDKAGRPYYGHVGNGVGGYSNFFVYPEQQMVVVFLINCTDPKVQEVLDEVVGCLHLDHK